MKKLTLLVILFAFLNNCSYAQQSVKSNKKLPFAINRVDISLLSANDFVAGNNAFENFVKTGLYSKEDFNLVLSLAKESNFPAGINTPEKLIARENEIKMYKVFYQGSWLQYNKDETAAETYYLFYIPQEDNLFMPKDMIPQTANGNYFIMNRSGFDTGKLPISNEPKPDFVKALQAKHYKNKLYKIENPYQNIAPGYGLGMEFGYKAMVTYGNYTLQEYARIKELASAEYWPSIFSNYKTGRSMESIFTEMTKYKAYLISNMADSSAIRDLVWIPKEGNEHMPAEMQPKTNEGFYIAIKTSERIDDTKLFPLRMSTPAGRLNLPIAGKNPNAIVISKPIATNTATTPKNNPVIDLVINDETFKKELLRLRLDADRGFTSSKGALIEKGKYNTYYDAQSSFYNNYNKDCIISYSAPWYAASTKENVAQRYFLGQSFDYSDKLGQFVYDNAERLLDEIAKENSFKKKFYKLDKEEKKKYKLIQYFKNEQVVLELSLTFDKKTSSINIFSDLKPGDQPNYLGSLVVYNIQSENLVSAIIYYVYGKSLDNPGYLHSKIVSTRDEFFKKNNQKYEWMPSASEQYVIEKLSKLGLDQRFRSSQKIDTNGNGLN
jgi:hypothetical protein